MKYQGQTAFITGGSSGLARALTQRLVEQGARVFIVDINTEAGESFVSELNQSKADSAYFAKCDVSNWDDLTSAFTKALNTFDRIDYVFPVAGITERQVVPKPSEQKDVRKHGFTKPDLTVIDVNLNAMINLILIAVQTFRGQEVKQELGDMKGKIVCVASTCGLYAMVGLPIYTASKHGMVGVVRTYGQILTGESITLNAICPHVVRTGISAHAPWFYEELERKGLTTDISRVIDGFETFLGSATESGSCYEVGPRGSRTVQFMDYMDDETKQGCDAATTRSGRIWKDA